MKEINCEVIKDLLPSYADKITSETTNKLVEEHLKHCNKCSKILEDMNKEIDTELFNQNEQIDYLRGFRKEKKIAIIKTICIFIIIMLVLFLFFQEIVSRFNFAVDINNLYISYNAEEKIDEKTEKVFLKDKKGNLKEIWNRDNGILIK